MAFPIAPVDKQVFIASTGLRYEYTAASNEWHAAFSPKSKDNVIAALPPSATDDDTAGYIVGSTWYDTVANNVWICTASGTAAATWLPLTMKHTASIVSPTVTDDTSTGVIIGSHWHNTVNGLTYMCIDSTVGAAVWQRVAFRPASASAQVPLLTAIPLIATTLVMPTPVLDEITHLAGVFTVPTAGTYELNYTANFEASAKRMGYYVNIVTNLVSDLISGTSFTDRNAASTRWSRIITINKTLTLTAGSTVSISHFTDDALATVSADFKLRRVA